MANDDRLGVIHVELATMPGAGRREPLDNLGSRDREFTSTQPELTSNQVLGKVVEIGEDELAQGLQAIANTVNDAMLKAGPESWSVELNIGFKAGAKVPVLMSGEANAALKVTLNWKRGS